MTENVRPEITKYIPANAKHILDLGCASGEVGESIKKKYMCEVIGIEIDEVQAQKAALKIDHVIVGNIEIIDPGFSTGQFDCIVFADVLEHLRDPQSILKKYLRYLSDGGNVIISVPNIRHISVLCEIIVKGEWRYRPFGILDEGHLRFFTYKSFLRLLKESGLEVIDVKRIFSLKGSKLVNFLSVGLLRDFLTAQYVFLLRKGDIR
jgi:O-antigen biosynthesis protein